MSFYEKGPVRIYFEEAGSGLPLLLIAGGGLNSTISGLYGDSSPFNPIEEFKGEYRCIASDLRNANAGRSSGPLEIERPWDAYTDDHLGLLDHLGIRNSWCWVIALVARSSGICCAAPLDGSSPRYWRNLVGSVRKCRISFTRTTSKAGVRCYASDALRSRWRWSVRSRTRCIAPGPISYSP